MDTTGRWQDNCGEPVGSVSRCDSAFLSSASTSSNGTRSRHSWRDKRILTPLPYDMIGSLRDDGANALKRYIVLGLLAIGIASLVVRCTTSEASLRYRMAVEVQTPSGLKSGSSV